MYVPNTGALMVLLYKYIRGTELHDPVDDIAWNPLLESTNENFLQEIYNIWQE